MDEPRSATPYLKVFMSHVSCLPVKRSSLPAHTKSALLESRTSELLPGNICHNKSKQGPPHEGIPCIGFSMQHSLAAQRQNAQLS